MPIMLGNLSVEQIEKRLGFSFPDDIKTFMKENQQHEAQDVKQGKWHCFDLPFHIVCGDLATATKIFDSVKHRSSEALEPLHFSLTCYGG
jgi:hypothetical protein